LSDAAHLTLRIPTGDRERERERGREGERRESFIRNYP
jgi:hypothetical protein